MKIQKFNENKAYQKKLKVIFSGDIIVDIEDVENTDAYYSYINNTESGESPEDMRNSALYYGLEEYLHDSGSSTYDFTLINGNGEDIGDEKEFDKKVELSKIADKYNI